ncbi:RiPP maturation radical SAM C-methyltransferase [Rhizobium ruizarguesonis]
MTASDVILVVPPFASVAMPALGPSILAAQLRARGITSRVLYGNLLLSSLIGVEAYQAIADSDVRHLIGERLCAASDVCWHAGKDLSDLSPELISHCRQISLATDRLVEKITGMHPKIVGFSSSFQQNVASIVAARRLRNVLPSVTLIIGGANVDAPMGAAFLNAFSDDFDFVFSGEADLVFPRFCVDVIQGRSGVWPRLIDMDPLEAKDFSIVPYFDDYFAQGGILAQQVLGERIVPFETSRGCWWGEKHHCTFCGLNANGMTHRSKDATVLGKEIDEIAGRYRPQLMFATDNILPSNMTRRHDVNPLADRDVSFFFETKSNLGTADLDHLVEMGVWNIQPGIESLSTSILKLLRKGNTGPQHICLLREASSRQINVIWNFLVDIPGDTEEAYEEMSRLLPHLVHLQPPTGCTPIRLDRFSPYFEKSEDHGVTEVRPLPAFSAVYGDRPGNEGFCYFFDGLYDSAFRRHNHLNLAKNFGDLVSRWRSSWTNSRYIPTLVGVRNQSGQYLVIDQRYGTIPTVTVVKPEEEQTLLKTKRPMAIAPLPPAERAVLETYVEREIVVAHEGYFVFLPSEPETGFQLREGAVARGHTRAERGGVEDAAARPNFFGPL